MDQQFCMSKTAPIVQTRAGKLRGFRYDGVDHFYGIRYAKAKRFQMPEPVKPWEGVKDANSYGMICPVLNEPMPTGEVMTPHRFWPSSEHCQYLNVWTDRCDPKAKKPVLFWIHGGGYAAGSSIEQIAYDGFNLAKDKDVVLVSVNHRLNAFGYLDLSSFGEKYKNSVNAGIADLMEALRWVRDNIAQFGGDPENVTIFGQSGGGGKVTVLGQIPEAKDLFAKMIVMSGVIPADDFKCGCTQRELVLAILKKLNIPADQVEKLEKVPVPQYIWAVNQVTADFREKGIAVQWSPAPNDWYLCDPLEKDFTPEALAKPTIVGTVLAEFGFPKDLGERETLTKAQREQAVLEEYGPVGGPQILAEFRKQYPDVNEVFAADLEVMFLPATVEYVEKKAAEATAPVYNYIFAKVFDVDGGKAAWHCSDIPYFLHNAALIPLCHQPGWEALDRMMSDAFVNFARTGDPNAEGLPRWEPCAKGKTVTMVLCEKPYVREGLQGKLLPLVKQYKPPFKFEFAAPENEDEESGNAWVF